MTNPIQGLTSTGRMVPVLVDATGRPLVVLDAITGAAVPVTQGTSPWIVAADGGDKIFSVEAPIALDVSNTALAAGSNTLTTTAVPVSKLWIITHISWKYVGTVATVQLVPFLTIGGVAVQVTSNIPPVSNQWYDRQGQFVMGAADTISLQILFATLNDDGFLRASGYQMGA